MKIEIGEKVSENWNRVDLKAEANGLQSQMVKWTMDLSINSVNKNKRNRNCIEIDDKSVFSENFWKLKN